MKEYIVEQTKTVILEAENEDDAKAQAIISISEGMCETELNIDEA